MWGLVENKRIIFSFFFFPREADFQVELNKIHRIVDPEVKLDKEYFLPSWSPEEGTFHSRRRYPGREDPPVVPDEPGHLPTVKDPEEPRHGGQADEKHHTSSLTVCQVANRLCCKSWMREDPAYFFRRNLLPKEVDSCALILPGSRDEPLAHPVFSSRETINGERKSKPGTVGFFARKTLRNFLWLIFHHPQQKI